MPAIIEETGIGVDLTVPNPYARPSPITNFRWVKETGSDYGYLKWDKALDSEMSGGLYRIQRSTDSGSNWSNLTTLLQSAISGTTGTYQDLTGNAGNWYQIRKENSVSVASIYVGPAIYLLTTDYCYLLLYIKDLSIDVFANAVMTVAANVLSTVKYLTYKGKAIVPNIAVQTIVESDSGLLIVPIIPTAYLTNGVTPVKYNITIIGRGNIKVEFSDKTVPTAESAYVLDLT